METELMEVEEGEKGKGHAISLIVRESADRELGWYSIETSSPGTSDERH